MPNEATVDPIVCRYIRDRLTRETEIRGSTARIAEAMKLPRQHIANVVDGTIGARPAFAAAIAEYWGITQTELHRLAHKQYETPDRDTRSHPELEAVLLFCRGAYPVTFLTEFEQDARRHPDRPQREWFIKLQGEFPRWIERKGPPAGALEGVGRAPSGGGGPVPVPALASLLN